MRADYGLYAVAVICFLIAALPYMNVVSGELLTLDAFTSTVFTVVFVALGLILIILGYSQRPKPVIFIPETTPSAPPLALPPSKETTTVSPSAHARKEVVEPEKEKPKRRTKRKATRRKRKKA